LPPPAASATDSSCDSSWSCEITWLIDLSIASNSPDVNVLFLCHLTFC
jgi:hypothetical protein